MTTELVQVLERMIKEIREYPTGSKLAATTAAAAADLAEEFGNDKVALFIRLHYEKAKPRHSTPRLYGWYVGLWGHRDWKHNFKVMTCDDIPPEIGVRLAGILAESSNEWYWYMTENEAMEELERAVIRWFESLLK